MAHATALADPPDVHTVTVKANATLNTGMDALSLPQIAHCVNQEHYRALAALEPLLHHDQRDTDPQAVDEALR
jgi:hypothetical protein